MNKYQEAFENLLDHTYRTPSTWEDYQTLKECVDMAAKEPQISEECQNLYNQLMETEKDAQEEIERLNDNNRSLQHTIFIMSQEIENLNEDCDAYKSLNRELRQEHNDLIKRISECLHIIRTPEEILDMLETSDIGGHMSREFWAEWLLRKQVIE